MASYKPGIGQHRDSGASAPNSGQRNVRGTAGEVGNMSGGEQNNKPLRSCAMSTTRDDPIVRRTCVRPKRERRASR